MIVVTCLLGHDVSAGGEDGITLDIPGVTNFNDLAPEESGLTLFVASAGRR